MSWSASAQVKSGSAVDLGVIKFTPQQGHGEKESQDAFSRAMESVSTLINSGVVGEGPYELSMSGHSNPGHQPSPGYSNDLLTIRITSLTKMSTAAGQAYDDGEGTGEEGEE